MAGAHGSIAHLRQALGNHATNAGKGKGALQSGLIHLLFDPAVFQQLVQNPGGLFPLGLESGFVTVITAFQLRRPGQSLFKDLDHLVPLQGFAVVRTGAV